MLDKVGIGLGFVDFSVDMAGLAIASATSLAGLVLSSIQGIVAMPLIFLSSDEKARYNGRIEGAADALQDCADQYKDQGFDFLGLSRWPTIKIPEIHGRVSPHASQSQVAWVEGQRQGRQKIMNMLLEMEQHPKIFTLPDGKNLRISGRIWLRLISKKHKDSVGVEFVIKPTNAELKAKGQRPFPTI